MKRAIVLLSGGIDSAVTLAIARQEDYQCHALAVDYGQRHVKELEYARRTASDQDINFRVATIRSLLSSTLTEPIVQLPKEGVQQEEPPTYVPARNIILLGLALNWAEVLEAEAIYIGANRDDRVGYPDCRPIFFGSFQQAANVGTVCAVKHNRPVYIKAPLTMMSKKDIVSTGALLAVDFSLTRSCYDLDGEGISCGLCDACRLRLKAFEDAKLNDPIPYKDKERS